MGDKAKGCEGQVEIRFHARIAFCIQCDSDEPGHEGDCYAVLPTRIGSTNVRQRIQWSDEYEQEPKPDEVLFRCVNG